MSLLLELHRDSIVKIIEPHIRQNIVVMAGADSWRQRNAVVLALFAVFSVKDLLDLEVGEFSIVNAVLENVKDKGHDVVCFNVIRVLDVLLSNYMDDLFKATDMSHLECLVRATLVLFRDENGSIVVESTDAIPSFVEGVQDSYNCQQLSVSPLSPFFKTLIEQLFDVASRNVNEEDVVNSSFAAVGSLCKSAPPNCKELVGEIPNTVVSFHSSFVASSLSSRGTVCDTNIANMVESIEMCIDRLDSAITPSSQRILDFTNDVLERGFGPLSQEASIRLISSLSGPCPSVIEPVFFQRLLNFFLNNLLQADEFDLFECTADSLGTISRNI